MSNYIVPPQVIEMAAPHSVEMTPLKGPSEADWERHRPLIKQFYVDEGMKLKEIMPIMLQYRHKASPRTYRNWINKWGFDKKNKKRDMVAIVRKKTQREAVGKRSSFRVRGQVITTEQVESYFKRKKKAVDVATVDAPTPSDVSCWTPSPLGTPKPLEEDEEHEPILTTNNRLTQGQQHFPEVSLDNGFMEAQLVAVASSHLPQLRIDNETLQLAVQDVCNTLSENPKLCHSPLPPQELIVLERLFFNIKAHIDGLFESGLWTLDANGQLRNTKSLFEGTLEHNFWNYYVSATRLLSKSAFVEARRALSKMFNLIYDLILSVRPWTLHVFLQVFLDLKSRGHHEISLALQRYICAMARKVIPNDSPWSYICQILFTFDEKVLEQTIIESLKCSNERIMNFVGLFSPGFLSVHPNFVECAYMSNPLEAERLIRKILDESATIGHANSRQAIKIRHALGVTLFRQQRYAEAEIVLLDALSSGQDIESLLDEAEVKEVFALCLFYRNRRGLAELNMRDVISLRRKIWGISHPSVAGSILILQGWLKDLGREEEAAELKAEFDAIIGPDEVDLEMAQMNNQGI